VALARLSQLSGLACLISLAGSAAADASLEGLGGAAGFELCHQVRAVSGDGNVVVGGCGNSVSRRAWRWTRETGMVVPDLSAEMGDESTFKDLSHDGEVIVGSADYGTGGVRHAYRWTVSDGWTDLHPDMPTYPIPGCPACAWGSAAYSISPDGSFIGGQVSNVSLAFWEVSGFRWLDGEVETFLQVHAMLLTSAVAITDEGAMAVWSGQLAGPYWDLYFIDSDGAITDIDERIGERRAGISADGSALASGGRFHAFRWSAREGGTGLGPLPGADPTLTSIAYDISADGRVIVGKAEVERCSEQCNTETHAFVWTRATGTLELALALERQGVDLGGWQLISAVDVSADGTVIVGEGVNPQGESEGFRVILPEPSLTDVPALGTPQLALTCALIVAAARVTLRARSTLRRA
jgi:uncharacterized membrane protein